MTSQTEIHLHLDVEKHSDIPLKEIAWHDPNEERNPVNWPIGLKISHTLVPCLLAFWITFGTSVSVPATDLVAAHFNVSRTESILPLTLYTLGLALGPLVIAPLSEYLGRKWIYVITSSFLLAFTGGAAAAQNFSTLLVCRFLAGFLGSAGVAIGAGTLGDIWAFGKVGGIVSLFFILGPFLGPSFGPLAGAYILYNHDNNWRWTQYLLLMIGAPILLGTVLMRETSKDRILQQTGQKAIGGSSQATSLGKTLQLALVRPVKMLFTETVVLSLALYTAFAYAMVFSYFGSASYVLRVDYGFTLREVGLNFVSVIIGYILALVMFIVFEQTLHARALKAGVVRHRLYGANIPCRCCGFCIGGQRNS
ncbi:hypothetical protein BBP40_004306 [Aspergillus hancockii]|nr:hypothetical protein BBP40_004306 [Aspergillus hancockii]